MKYSVLIYIIEFILLTLISGCTNLYDGANNSRFDYKYSEKQGEALYYEGIKLRESGKHNEAISVLEKAVSIARANNNSFGQMNCLLIIGLSYRDIGQIQKSRNAYQEVLLLARKSGDIDREKSALSMLSITNQDHEKANENRQEMLSIARKQGDKMEEIRVLDDLASQQDEFYKRIHYIDQGIKASQESADKNSEFRHVIELAQSYETLGKIKEALEYAEQSMVLAKQSRNKKQEAQALDLYGQLYMFLGDHARAIATYQESLNLQEDAIKSAKGSERDELLILQMSTYWGLGGIQGELGNYAEQIDYYKKSRIFAKSINSLSDWIDKSPSYRGPLGIAYMLNGEKDKAAEMILPLSDPEIYKLLYYYLNNQSDKVVSWLNKSELEKVLKEFPKENIAFHSSVAGFGLYTVLGLAYEKLGELKLAEYCFKLSIYIVEQQRESLLEEFKGNFFESSVYPPFNRLTPYEGLIRISSQDEAFSYSESVKARVILEHLARFQEIPDLQIPENIRNQEVKLNNSIADLLVKSQIALKSGDKDSIIKYEKEIISNRLARDRLIDALYKDYRNYATIKYPKPLKASQISLHSDEVLIEYSVTDTKTLAWLIKNGEIKKYINIDITKENLLETVKKYRDQIISKEGFENPSLHYELGHKLYNILIKDFMPQIDSNNKIIFVPDKELGLLPFETLIIEPPKNIQRERDIKELSSVKYLGDNYDISYAQSASALTEVRSTNINIQPKKMLFILSDPTFSDNLELPKLNKTQELASNLIQLFQQEETDNITGVEASEKNLKNIDLSNYKYVVFATHGILESQNFKIREPSLVLGKTGNNQGDDGLFTMTEIMGSKFNADLVALTACNTGSGKIMNGEGIIGLGRAFQYAGAKSVLASLWSVNEEPSVNLTAYFIRNLKNGSNKSTALRLARNEIRKQFNHPMYWAPFILIGESN